MPLFFFFLFGSRKSRSTYRVLLGFATAAEFVPQGPGAHADADDEDASRYHRHQRHHRCVLRGRRGGGRDVRAQRGTLDLIRVDEGLLRDAADDVVVYLGSRGPVRLELRGLRMILLGRERR